MSGPACGEPRSQGQMGVPTLGKHSENRGKGSDVCTCIYRDERTQSPREQQNGTKESEITSRKKIEVGFSYPSILKVMKGQYPGQNH